MPEGVKGSVSTCESPTPALAMGGLAGGLSAVQLRVSAGLGDALGAPLVAALFAFASALALLLLLAALRSSTRAGFARLRTSGPPPWLLLGGVFGAAYVAAFTWTVPTIGAALFTVATITGRMLGGMLVDAFGIGPRGRHVPTVSRLSAAGLAIVAIALTQIGRPLGEIAIGLIVVAVAANIGTSFQFAINGRLQQGAGEPMAATTVHFTTGMVVLAAVVCASAAGNGLDTRSWPSEPWLYLGGVLGIAIVALFGATARRVDVLRIGILVNGGQVVGSLLLDLLVPGGPPPTVWVALGSLLALGAITIPGRPGLRDRNAPPQLPRWSIAWGRRRSETR